MNSEQKKLFERILAERLHEQISPVTWEWCYDEAREIIKIMEGIK